MYIEKKTSPYETINAIGYLIKLSDQTVNVFLVFLFVGTFYRFINDFNYNE